MKFIAFGLNHESASLAKTEAFSLSDADCEAFYEQTAEAVASEFVVLSTCNRTELYVYGEDADAERLMEALSDMVGKPWPPAASFRYVDEEAVRHIFEVASGIRSLVPGDAQILAQMKEAYQQAVDAEAVDMVMHRLMHTAFHTAKQVAQETEISTGAASVSTAAVALAESLLEQSNRDLTGADVLLVGAGQMGQLALQAVKRYQPNRLLVTNRSPARAQKVAEKYGATVVDWEERHAVLPTVDVAFAMTGAPEPIVLAEPLLEQKSDEDSSTVIVDIARPRNVESAVGMMPGFEVRDLDALQGWVESVRDQRQSEVPYAKNICDEQLSSFVSWVFHQEALQPAIDTIRSTFEDIRQQEIDRHKHRFSDADEDELNQITQSILQKLLAVPIVRLKSVDPDSIDYVRGIRLLSALFEQPSEQHGDTTPSETPSSCPYGEKTADEEPQSVEPALDIQQLRRILGTIDELHSK